ncbi:MAG TPA: glutamine--fructose-6-phosphate transaminase (isomerizing) [Elusimicrobiota bacterium]|nr:glutamine--fructose-6-phosphate transaminase (isomerizing) [Elusimicrobiota bacterium]
MCGIVGYVGTRQAGNVLLDGLKRLEYRGYDSAGMVVASPDGQISIRRSVGKLAGLETLFQQEPLVGQVGIGHTRWATHGKPSEENAHPHQDCTGRIVVVHNGIIENYPALKSHLIKNGHTFRSQTDTEVVAHLIEEKWVPLKEKNRAAGADEFLSVVREVLLQLEGSYALGILCMDLPDMIIGARKNSPLVLGVGENENIFASDIPAILPLTRDAIFLDEGEIVVLSKSGYRVLRLDGQVMEKPIKRVTWDAVMAEKAGYRHFMLKEIHEQPQSIEDTLRGRLNLDEWQVYLEYVKMEPDVLKSFRKAVIIACGTSYHAGKVGKFLAEKWVKLPCEVDIASEFRYREPLLGPKDLIVAISQSGETADTIAAIRYARSCGAKVLSICNVVGSTIARESDGKIYTRCGPEIGVASTKAFTGQLTALYLLTLYGGLVRGGLDKQQTQTYLSQILLLPRYIREVLKREEEIAALAKKYFKSKNFLYLGRHMNYPIALEGALKLKEISYIHAEGYAAGEMKHGPIALIDESMPIVAIATKSCVYEKMISNIEEAKARGGIVIALATEGDQQIAEKADHVIYLPAMPEFLSPCVNVVPLQMLAYYIAVLRGCDVDQPRNLAKSVTVE